MSILEGKGGVGWERRPLLGSENVLFPKLAAECMGVFTL